MPHPSREYLQCYQKTFIFLFVASLLHLDKEVVHNPFFLRQGKNIQAKKKKKYQMWNSIKCQLIHTLDSEDLHTLPLLAGLSNENSAVAGEELANQSRKGHLPQGRKTSTPINEVTLMRWNLHLCHKAIGTGM